MTTPTQKPAPSKLGSKGLLTVLAIAAAGLFVLKTAGGKRDVAVAENDEGTTTPRKPNKSDRKRRREPAQQPSTPLPASLPTPAPALPQIPMTVSATQQLSPGLIAMYFNVPRDFSLINVLDMKPATVRIDPRVDFDWGVEAPAERISPGRFAVRWSGLLKVNQPGVYTFRINHDGGARVMIAGRVIYGSARGRAKDYNADAEITTTGYVPFEAQFLARGRRASLRIEWAPPGASSFQPMPPEVFVHPPIPAGAL